MTPASLLLALLSFSPPAEDAAEPPAPEVSDVDQHTREYDEALERVRTAQRMANEDPGRGSVQLRDALHLLQGFGPTLAKDPEGQDLRTMAQLTLARSLLATEEAEAAREAMDDAIRTSRGDPLPTKQFGPGLTALHKERAGALAKQASGTIEVECRIPCRVYINERPTQPQTDGLVPGTYRVWIEANDRSQPDVQTSVEIGEGLVAPIEFGIAPEPPPELPPKKPKRIMPRWAEVVLMTAGAAAVGTGAALWAIDGTCPNGVDPTDTDACPQVYITKTAGIATLAIGGAALLSGTIMLTVDEVRAGSDRGSEVALTWRVQF
ncbi:hypothetical protein ENSA5_51310 [Enhygromyxa salina]|uniref:PEGA domain-containing protein n=1 Tax=Enhygromyxa salina TaxID=215803 RepID=A0A2S9XH47_9BACT|nr:hypothetical protein [Enhygromyxa salina]PRP92182.1 hypothetical protein ENSA5_51310 [Enhygromyxa salina]